MSRWTSRHSRIAATFRSRSALSDHGVVNMDETSDRSDNEIGAIGPVRHADQNSSNALGRSGRTFEPSERNNRVTKRIDNPKKLLHRIASHSDEMMRCIRAGTDSDFRRRRNVGGIAAWRCHGAIRYGAVRLVTLSFDVVRFVGGDVSRFRAAAARSSSAFGAARAIAIVIVRR
jgi:hypothetical protein